MPYERSRRKQLPVSAEYETVLAIEMPGDGVIAAVSFVATKLDGSGTAVCRHLQGAPVASGESVGGVPIGGKGGLALALQAGDERKSLVWCLGSGSSGNM